MIIGLGILWSIGYFYVYRKLLGGKKKFTIKQIILGFAFAGYIIMVIGVTFLNRGAHFEGTVNLHLLSSYRDAWNGFTLMGWQQLILNILMFVPLGILLPLVHKRFHKIKWTMGIALAFTLFIECIQLITGFGIFELDDIFNNVLGALIGYGIIMAILTMLDKRRHRFLKVISYLSPLILVFGVFTGIFTYYNLQEFGNLSLAYNYKINMKNTKVSLNLELNNDRIEAPIYKAPIYNKDSAKEFAISFLENKGIDTSDIEVDAYNDNAIYWVRDNPSYNIWFNYLDGSYSYKDFSAFDDYIEPIATDKETLLHELDDFNIQIPAKAVFNYIDTENYEWVMEREVVGDSLREGSISCRYYSDGSIKEINNSIISYNKIKDILIKSEKEAYEELMDGKFRFYNLEDNMEHIDIRGVELDYRLDSKGYYQPVYSFDSIVGGKEFEIIIPALL